jgi:GT2 family glycosyltransferase
MFVDAVSGCVMLIRRSVFDAIGPLAEDYFFTFEDVDFCARAHRAGFRVVCALEARATHHGSRTIGARSARRIYFATRNHLLMLRRTAPPLPRTLTAVRTGYVIALNLAHALSGRRSPIVGGVAAFGRGLWHHLLGRYGEDTP